jgi:uncharacterized membrane protein
MYDNADQLLGKKDLIMRQVVLTKTMPQNNKTQMMDEEPNQIRSWIEQGAHLD